jgi:hypothetical protein
MANNKRLVDIIIPIAPYHSDIAEHAIDSARAQTLSCGVIPYYDEHGNGAGYARNRAIERSDALFVVPLDADDTLRPDAVERMIDAYQKPGTYIYTDDFQDESLHQTSDLGFYDGNWWHTVSCLIPTVLFRAVGGFDETLPGLEDMELFLRLQAHGICGVRCPHPLLMYSAHGQRSQGFLKLENHRIIRTDVLSKWSWRARMACGCGNGLSTQQVSAQDGDVLARALYSPRQMGGPVTGRLYPKPMGFQNYVLSIDPRDLSHPKGRELWEPVLTYDPVAVAPDVDTVMALAREAMVS